MASDGRVSAVLLDDRGVVAVGGEEAKSFLQGLVSNDVTRVAPDRAIYAALLTPQGKYLFDFVIVEHAGQLLLDTERARLPDLVKRLTMYKLRAKVTVADASEAFAVAAAFGPGAAERLGLPSTAEAGAAAPFAGGVACVDPRLAALGARVVLPRGEALAALDAAGFAAADAPAWDRWRLAHGVPDGTRDLMVDKSFLLESNFEELNGVDFHKGCYVGQENTTRSKFRGVVRKRLFRVEAEGGAVPPPGTPLMAGDREVGIMRSGRDGQGLALLRLEEVEAAGDAPLVADGVRLVARKPDWASF
jgi:folate-binding protein YgfZ